MEVTAIETKVNGTSKINVVRMALFSKLLENNLYNKFSTTGFEILVNLYLFGGTSNKDSMQKFFLDCYDKNLTKVGAENSIRNTLTLARSFGVVKRKKANDWRISKLFIPECTGEYLVYKGLITNYAIK